MVARGLFARLPNAPSTSAIRCVFWLRGGEMAWGTRIADVDWEETGFLCGYIGEREQETESESGGMESGFFFCGEME